MADPINVSKMLLEQDFVDAPYFKKEQMLDGAEKRNLGVLEERYKSSLTDTDSAMKYADSIGRFQSVMRKARFATLGRESQQLAKQYSELKGIDLAKSMEMLSGDQPLDDVHMENHRKWIVDKSRSIHEELDRAGASAFSRGQVVNAQGVSYGEMNVYKNKDGTPYAAVKLLTDENGAFIPPYVDDGNGNVVANPNRGQASTIKLRDERDEDLKKLAIQRDKLEKDYDTMDKAVKNTAAWMNDMSGQGLAAADRKRDSIKSEIDALDEKAARWKDGHNGMARYLQDQTLDILRTDPRYRERLPHGGWKTRLIADSVIGLSEQTYQLGAAGAMAVGAKETARSLSQMGQDMELARSVWGLGHSRNDPDSLWAQAITTLSDQLPLMISQFGVGRLMSMSAQAALTGMAERKVQSSFADALAKVSGDAIAKGALEHTMKIDATLMAKRWGDKIGSVLASMPMSAQDAASNIAEMYNQVDALEAQAKQMKDGPKKEALLAKARDIDGNSALAFYAHFASTGSLEFLPMEQLLKRAPSDKGFLNKVFAKITGNVADKATAAEVSRIAAAKSGLFTSRLNEWLKSKLGPRLTTALEQGSTEALTEALQQFSDNNIARAFYNDNQDLAEGIPQSSWGGMVVGGAMGFLTANTSKQAVETAVNHAQSIDQRAKQSVKEMFGKPMAAALDNGVVAHPVEDVVKQKKEDGTWFVEDPDLPSDAPGGGEVFKTASDARMFANRRWERYGIYKLGKIMSQTEGPDGKGWDEAGVEGMTVAINNMMHASARASGVSSETMWKAFSTSLQFADEDVTHVEVPDVGTAEHDAVITRLRESLGKIDPKNPDYKAFGGPLTAHLDAYENEVKRWQAEPEDTRGAMPVPSPELAVVMSTFNTMMHGGATPINQGPVELNARGIKNGEVNAPTPTKTEGDVGTYEGRVEKLGPNQVFVFGSNPEGFHGAGSAGFASFGEPGNVWRQKGYGSQPAGTKGRWNVKGQGEGLQQGTEGQSYALPTVAKPGAKRSLTPEQIKANIKKMYDAAAANPDKEFLVAQDAEGGLNGYSGKEMAEMFKKAGPIPSNVKFNSRFAKVLRGEKVEPTKQTRHAMGFRDEATGERTIDWVKNGTKTSTTRNWGKDLPSVGDVITFQDGEDEVPVRVKSVERVGDLKKRTGKNFREALARGEGWTEHQMSQFYSDPEHKTVKDWAHKVTFERLDKSVETPSTDTGPASPSMDQFMESQRALIEKYNKALEGEKSDLPEMATLDSLKKAGKLPDWVNQNGTVNVQRLLEAIPLDSPMGDLAILLKEVLPLLSPGDESLKFRVHPDTMNGVVESAKNKNLVVGEGPAKYDTIGLQATVTDVLGTLLPRITESILNSRINATMKSILGRGPMMGKYSEDSNFREGAFAAERKVASMAHMRAIFEMAMPNAVLETNRETGEKYKSVRSGSNMQKSIMRGLMSRAFGGKLPADKGFIKAISDGDFGYGVNAPSNRVKEGHYVQVTADGRVVGWSRDGKGEWVQHNDFYDSQAWNEFDDQSVMGKLSTMYLRSVMAGGHFEALWGDVENGGLAGTKLNRSEYDARGHSVPWALTSLPRFVAEMIANPAFAIKQGNSAGWLPAAPNFRRAMFNIVVGQMLGATDAKATPQEAHQVVGAAMLATGFKMQRSLRKTSLPRSGQRTDAPPVSWRNKTNKQSGATVVGESPGDVEVTVSNKPPGPTPIKSTIEQNLSARQAAQHYSVSYGGVRQDATGATPVQYDQFGNEALRQPNQADMDTDEIRQSLPATQTGNDPLYTRDQLSPEEKKLPISRRVGLHRMREQAAGRDFLNKAPQKAGVGEHMEYEQDDYDNEYLNDQDLDEEGERVMVEDQLNHTSTDYYSAQAEAVARENSDKVMTLKGERALAAALKSTGIMELIGEAPQIDTTSKTAKTMSNKELADAFTARLASITEGLPESLRKDVANFAARMVGGRLGAQKATRWTSGRGLIKQIRALAEGNRSLNAQAIIDGIERVVRDAIDSSKAARKPVESSESPQTSLWRAINTVKAVKMGDKVVQRPLVPRHKINELIRELQGKLPPSQIEQIGVDWHDAHLGNNIQRIDDAVGRLYRRWERKYGTNLTGEQKRTRRLHAEQLNAWMREQTVPSNYEAGLKISPSREILSDALESEEEGTAPEGQDQAKVDYSYDPVKAVKPSEVAHVGTSQSTSEEALREYVRSLPKERVAHIHDLFNRFAKLLGIDLQKTYTNSTKKERIDPTSLEDWGRLEVALSALNKGSNVEQLSKAFPGVNRLVLAGLINGDQTIMRDMHAMASAFVDRQAAKLAEQGKAVVLASDPMVADRILEKGEKDKNSPSPVIPGLSTQEEAGPYVAVDATSFNEDLAQTGNQPGLGRPFDKEFDKPLVKKGTIDPKTGKPMRPSDRPGVKPSGKEMSAGVSRDFMQRPHRYGNTAQVAYSQGLQPFLMQGSSEVPLTDDTKLPGLGNRTAREVFTELTNGLRANADIDMIRTIYENVWKKGLSGPRGRQILNTISDTLAEKRQVGELPLVSPEVPESQQFSPAQAIAGLLNKGAHKQLNQSVKARDLQGQRRAFIDSTSRMITMLKNGDPSSMIHETVHWLRLTKLSGGMSLFQAVMGSHYDEFMKWATDGGKLDMNDPHQWEQVEERIAEGAEQYLRESSAYKNGYLHWKDSGVMKGKSNGMKMAFYKLSQLIRGIYASIREELVQLNADALKGYDILFGFTKIEAPAKIHPEWVSVTTDEVSAAVDRADAVYGTGKVSKELAQRALDEERNMDTSLMPFSTDGETPMSVDDPATMIISGAQLSASVPPGWAPAAGVSHPEPKVSELRLLFRRGTHWFKRWFLAMRGMDWKVFHAMNVKLSGQRQSFERIMHKHSNALVKAMQSHLKTVAYWGEARNFERQELHRKVNSYLIEKDPSLQLVALANLPTRAIKEAAAAMRMNVDRMSDELLRLGIADGALAATIDDQKGYYLHRSYSLIENPKYYDMLRNGNLQNYWLKAVEVIEANRGVSRAEAEATAEFIVQAALGVDFKTAKTDPKATGVSVLMERSRDFEDVAEARDLLWGLKEDPVLNYQRTVNQISSLIATNTAMENLLQIGMAGPNPFIKQRTDPVSPFEETRVYFFDDKKPADFENEPVQANIKTKLAGYRTTPEVAQYVTDLVNDMSTVHGPVARMIMALNGWFKVSNTVLNWTTALRNLYTATVSTVGNGHFRPKHYFDAISLFTKDALNRDLGADEALFQELVENNIAESATLAEMRDYFKNAFDADTMVEKVFDQNEMVTWAQRTGAEAGLSYKKARKFFTELHLKFYNGCDTVAKIAAYLHEKENVADMFPAMSAEDIKSEAARRTHLTMFSFDMLNRASRFLRHNLPAIGPFVSFPLSMMRTSVSILELAGRDMATGTKRLMNGETGGGSQLANGIQRLVGFSALVASGEVMREQMKKLLGWDDDDDKAARELLPDWDKEGNIMWLSRKGEKLTYLNLSNLFPTSILNDAVSTFFRKRESGDGKAIGSAIFQILRPFMEEQYLAYAARVAADQRNPDGSPIINDGMSMTQQFEAMLAAFIVPMVPGHAKNLIRLDLLPQGEAGQVIGSIAERANLHPGNLTAEQKALYSAGFRLNNVDVEQAYKFKARDWVNSMRTSVSNIISYGTSQNQILQSDLDTAIKQAQIVHEKVAREGFVLTRRLQQRFGLSSEKFNDALKAATQREGNVSGGKLDERQRDAITLYGSWGNKPIGISEQSWHSMVEAALARQPVRYMWLEGYKAANKLDVHEGR